MASQMQLAFFLAIIGLVHGKPTAEQNSLYSLIFANDEKKVILDDKIDALLPSIREFILENGLDPTQVADFFESIFPHLPGSFKGKVELNKGWLQNLSTIKRTKHVIGIYKNKSLTLDMDLGFDVLDCSYEYYLKYLFYKRKGDVYARFYNLDVNIKLTIDLANYYIHLDSIKFSEVRKYDIKFEGHLLDPVLNVLTKAVTVIFQQRVLSGIEDRSMKIFGAKIDEWNEKIPRPNFASPIKKLVDTLDL
ncbi:hypothetical protein ACFW04_008232 [Cataglyphis niger]